jgi:hypothetical protein
LGDSSLQSIAMKPTPSRLALRVLGALLLTVAAIRFAMGFFRSVHASELTPPDRGFVMQFSTDYITLSLGAVGVLLCVLSFRARRGAA